jgi:hypothetical protein
MTTAQPAIAATNSLGVSDRVLGLPDQLQAVSKRFPDLHGKCKRCEWPMTLTDGKWRHDYTLQALVCGLSWAGEALERTADQIEVKYALGGGE